MPAVRDVLLAWRAIAPANSWELVWPNTEGRPAYDVHDREEWYGLQGAVEIGHEAGRYYSVYEARHGFATSLMEGGEDYQVITSLMGQSSILSTRG